MNRRRFVHLAVNTVVGRRDAYALHRINVSGFFYPRKPATPQGGGVAETKDDGAIEDAHLPHAAMTFYPCPKDRAASGTVDFMPLGSSKNDIVTLDQDGRAVLYGTASHAVHILPPVHTPKSGPISLTVGDSLYVMKRYPSYTNSHFFEALIHGHRPDITYLPPTWYWRSLPPPPFAYDTRDPYSWGDGDVGDNLSEVAAYTVVNGSDIWVTQGGRTYSFNTVSSAWSNVGDWTLPFQGHAQYVPEHKLWFGFSSDDNLLCASDLSGTPMPPQLHDLWKDLAPPEEGLPLESYLVPLGSGKFCVAKLFVTGRRSNFDYDERFAVLTGVEVQRCGKDGTGLRMVKHRSRRYSMNRAYFFRVF